MTFEEEMKKDFPTAHRVGLLNTMTNGQRSWLKNTCLDKERMRLEFEKIISIIGDNRAASAEWYLEEIDEIMKELGL